MKLNSIELVGFKSFAKKHSFNFDTAVTAIVGPNGSGKSNVAEAFRFVLGEQSMKSMRTRRGEDLIFSGGVGIPRSNRASVAVSFDNKDGLLGVDFEEVTIERLVHRDGANEYRLNGSHVRLRDVVELLAGANIGSSGHHIISQGEADRVLSASPQERREILMDALGLKVYQYKKAEALKKLEKTEENKKEVESLRRENAPHLKFLKRQVEKVERAQELRSDLVVRYREYLAQEKVYLAKETARLQEEKRAPEKELKDLESSLESVRSAVESADDNNEDRDELLALDRDLTDVRRKRDALTRELGKIEGGIAAREQLQTQKLDESVARSDVETFARDIDEILSNTHDESVSLKSVIESVREKIKTFLSGLGRATDGVDKELEKLKEERQRLSDEATQLEAQESDHTKKYQELQRALEMKKDEGRDAEREMFRIMTRQGELRTTLAEIKGLENQLGRDETAFEEELREAVALVGAGIRDFQSETTNATEERSVQEKRRKELEKLKVRLEEAGVGSADEILKEYEDVTARDAFLERELEDLKVSVEKLATLIEDLDVELDTKFKKGLNDVNDSFQKYFALMFGGGTAKLSVTKQKKRGAQEDDDEEEKFEEGVEVAVNLPKKKVKGLMALSGGERALTSIALIFAMTAVNPPPFLILDETDAALDEANSRRYGDMIEELAKHSQLIVITHNRETMSRADVLYGVTMGADGVSKLLSVKFDEAVSVAK